MSERFIKIGFADWQIWGLFFAFYPLIMFLSLGKFTELTYLTTGIYFGWGACRFVAHYFEWSLAKIKENQIKNKRRKRHGTRN